MQADSGVDHSGRGLFMVEIISWVAAPETEELHLGVVEADKLCGASRPPVQSQIRRLSAGLPQSVCLAKLH